MNTNTDICFNFNDLISFVIAKIIVHYNISTTEEEIKNLTSIILSDKELQNKFGNIIELPK